MKLKIFLIIILAILMSIILCCTINNTYNNVQTKESSVIVYFGKYEMDGNLNNGLEDIPWRVFRLDNDSVILVADKIIDCMPYNEVANSSDWDSCSLNSWLNTTFYEMAFDNDEKIKITQYETKENEASVDYNAKTNDRIFILNSNEINQYFPTASDRITIASEYSYNKGTLANPDDHAAWWWIRSNDIDKSYAFTVDYLGDETFTASNTTNNVDIDYYGIRPALILSVSREPLINSSKEQGIVK